MSFLLTDWAKIQGAAPWSYIRSAHRAVSHGDYIWMCGGSANVYEIGYGWYSFLLNDVWKSLDGINWEEVTPEADWSVRNQFAFIYFDSKFWIFGGYTWGGALNDIWSSVDGVTWVNEGNAAWSARQNHDVVEHNGKLWIVGGASKKDVWSSSDGVNWSLEGNAPVNVSNYALASFSDKLWIYGNNFGSNTPYSSYNGADWTTHSAVAWSARSLPQTMLTSDGSKIALIGGTGFNDVWESSDGTSWTSITQTTPFISRDYGAFASHKGNAVRIDGWRSDASTKEVWASEAFAAANFMADRTFSYVSASIAFSNLSTGSPSTFLWDFGDGTTAVTYDASHTYDSSGLYSVSLVTDSSYTELKTDYIRINKVPIPDFTSDVTSGDYPLTVTFEDLSTETPVSWSWDFGDGSSSTEQNPVNLFAFPGVFDVSLTLDGSFTNTKTGYIRANIPTLVPAFVADVTSGVAALTTDFTDLSVGFPTNWTWTFGDGDSTTAQNPSHTYAFPGVYSVALSTGRSNQPWSFIRSSSSGARLFVGAYGDFLYTSSNYGVNWTRRTVTPQNWVAGTSSSDGKHLVAGLSDPASIIYLSHNYGVDWSRISLGSFGQPWPITSTPTYVSPAISDDGSVILAADYNGSVWTSVNAGLDWTAHLLHGVFDPDFSPLWGNCAMSADGSNMALCDYYFGYIHTSNNSGVTWTKQTDSSNRVWTDIVSSSTGRYLAASYFSSDGTGSSAIYMSDDSGVTWTEKYYHAGYGVTGVFDITPSGSTIIGTLSVNSGGLDNYLLESTNYGTSWSQKGAGQLDVWTGAGLSDDGTKIAACVSNSSTNLGFIHLSADSGGTFTQAQIDSTSFTRLYYVTVGVPPTANFTATPRGGVAPVTVDFTDLSVNIDPLIGWWKGENNLVDSVKGNSINSYDGAYDVGYVGNCFSLSAAPAQNIYISNIRDYNFNAFQRFAWECYIKVIGTGNDFGDFKIIGAYLNCAFISGNFIVRCYDSAGITYDEQVYEGVYSFGAWFKFRLTFNLGRYELYIDDIKQTPVQYFTAGTFDSAGDFYWITLYSSVPTENYTLIDELKLYNSDSTSSTWLWDFGDDSTSYSQSPSHVYATKGLYDVSLRVNDVYTETKTDYILSTDFTGKPVSGPAALNVSFAEYPTAKFSYSLEGALVDFTNTSIGALTYDWNFGDGSHSSLINPVYEFSGSGIKTVTLTALNGALSSDYSSEIEISSFLVSWYKGDNDSFDSVGGNTAEWYTETYAEGYGGRCFDMEIAETGDYGYYGLIWIQHMDAYDFSESQKFKLSFYFKFGDAYGPGISVYKWGDPWMVWRLLIRFEEGYTEPDMGYISWGNPDTGEQTYLETLFNPDTWYFIEATINHGELKVYMDGVLLTPEAVVDYGLYVENGGDINVQNISQDYFSPVYIDALKIYVGDVSVEPLPPEALFDYTISDKRIDCTGNSIAVPTSWNYNWGDGSNDTVQNPTHTYAEYSDYRVDVTVTDADGTNSSSTNLSVWELPPSVTFTKAVDVPTTDIISPAVHLVWGNFEEGVYNSVTETFFDFSVSPADVEWGYGVRSFEWGLSNLKPIGYFKTLLQDPTQLTYTQSLNGDTWSIPYGGLSSVAYNGDFYIYIHIISEDKYYALHVTDGALGGTFTYTRYGYIL